VARRLVHPVACERGDIIVIANSLSAIRGIKTLRCSANPERLAIIIARLDWLMDAEESDSLTLTFKQLKSKIFQWLTTKQIEHALSLLEQIGMLVVERTDGANRYSFPDPSPQVGETLSPSRGDPSPQVGETLHIDGIKVSNEELIKHPLTSVSAKDKITDPYLLELAEQVNKLISREMATANQLPGTLKLETQVTADILRQLRDIDKVDIEDVGWVIKWAWTDFWDGGSCYGSVLVSPGQWRVRKKGAAMNKFQIAYSKWFREAPERYRNGK